MNKPRFLLRSDIAPRVKSEPESIGYTELAARGMHAEPEPLDEADWKRYIAPRRDQSEAERLAAEQRARDLDARLLSQEERVVKVDTDAKAKRRDISREMYAYNRMKAQGRPAHVLEKRVQAMERVVYIGRRAA